MKKVVALVLVLICTLCFWGCGPSDTPKKLVPDLNMETLQSLVDIYDEKDKELSWDTFAPYYCSIEVGSETYIRRYSVDEDYYLIIEGVSIEESPMHMKLVLKDDPNKYIDIRTENIDDFINAN